MNCVEGGVTSSQNTTSPDVYNSISTEFRYPSSHNGGQRLTCGSFNPFEKLKQEKQRLVGCEGMGPYAMNLAQPGQSNINNTFNHMAILGDVSQKTMHDVN